MPNKTDNFIMKVDPVVKEKFKEAIGDMNMSEAVGYATEIAYGINLNTKYYDVPKIKR